MPNSTSRPRNHAAPASQGKPLWIWAALACVVGIVIAIFMMRGNNDYDFYKSSPNGVAPTAAGPEFAPLPGPGSEAPEVAPDASVDLGAIVGKTSDTQPFIINDPAPAPPAPAERAPEPAAPVQPIATGPTASGPRNALPKAIPGQSPLPEYPREAYRNQESGTVRVRVTINPQGDVVNSQLEVSSQSQALDRAAVSAVRNWKFTAAYRDGQPIQSDAIVPVEFTL